MVTGSRPRPDLYKTDPELVDAGSGATGGGCEGWGHERGGATDGGPMGASLVLVRQRRGWYRWGLYEGGTRMARDPYTRPILNSTRSSGKVTSWVSSSPIMTVMNRIEVIPQSSPIRAESASLTASV